MDTINDTSIFASDIGLPVGRWPTVVHLHDQDWRFDAFERDDDGDITSATYWRIDHGQRRTLIVFND